MKKTFFIVSILLLSITFSNALHFYIIEGRDYCFLEDLMGEMPVVVSYSCPLLEPAFRAQLAYLSRVINFIKKLIL